MTTDKIISYLLYFLGLLFNIALIAVIAFLFFNVVNRAQEFGFDLAAAIVYEGPDEEVQFVLTEDTPAAEVARRLEEMGLISSWLVYYAENFLLSRPDYYRAGVFTLNRNMSNNEIHRALRWRPAAERVPHLVITIREGWTLRDMAEYFESRDFFTAEEFLHVAQYGHFSFSFLRDVPTDRPNRLEGYLFPETYFISLNPTPGEIITIMLRQFERIFDEAMIVRAEEMDITIDEAVIMASIIEAETRLAAERPLVSQVIHRRLQIGMNLEMCSTVAYVMDVRRDRLLYEDLLIDSPYNTYMHPGLPIGPIGNPGLASLRAALWPADTDYLFFVLRNPATGEHFFSRTVTEHDAAARRYLD